MLHEGPIAIFFFGPIAIVIDDGRKKDVFILCYLALASELVGALIRLEPRLVSGVRSCILEGRTLENGLGLLIHMHAC